MFKITRIRRFFSSVFTKLIFISLFTWFLILVAIFATFLSFRHDTKGPFYRNASRYIQYIVDDIGSPPSKQRAFSLSQRTGMQLTFIGNGARWSTKSPFPKVEKIRYRSLHESKSMAISRRFGKRIIKLQTDDGLLFFEFAGTNEESRHHEKTQLLLFVFLSLILLGSYLAIKRVLQPLKWLNTGVHTLKQGNLTHRVPLRGNDELTDLAQSFNEMTGKLKSIMTIKENLLRDISHELRSPLTRMRVALELMEDSENRKDIAADIAEMEAMINGILETARDHNDSHRLTPDKYELGGLIEAVTLKYTESKPGITFTAMETPIYSLVDKNSLQTVVSNCIENGIKFSTDNSAPIEVSLKKEESLAKISIADHGSGINESDIPYLFDPFYRVDPSRSRRTGGYGLGLSICKSIIEAHNGTIEVQSSKGSGTRITITLALCS